MAGIAITHSFIATNGDSPDGNPTIIGETVWNSDHVIDLTGAGLVGGTGAGPAGLVLAGDGLSLTSGLLSLAPFQRLVLPATADVNTGVVDIGAAAFLHGFGTGNVFAGGAGNFTLTGAFNVAIGASAMAAATIGAENVYVGAFAGGSNTSGGANTAVGFQALADCTSGFNNVALGFEALSNLTTLGGNVALGTQALLFCVGQNNVGVGSSTLFDVTSGQGNTAIGNNSGRGITTGTNNTVLGANLGGIPSGLNNAIIIGAGDGVVQVDYNLTSALAWTFAAPVRVPGYTVATLPAASAALKGARAYVTNANAPTFLGALTGGGSVVCPVFCNGVAWVPG